MQAINYSTTCKCECHKKGSAVKHAQPCCSLTYIKYLNENNTVDKTVIEQFVKAVK